MTSFRRLLKWLLGRIWRAVPKRGDKTWISLVKKRITVSNLQRLSVRENQEASSQGKNAEVVCSAPGMLLRPRPHSAEGIRKCNNHRSFCIQNVEERFRKAPFSWRISVNGRPNRRDKAGFLTFSGVFRSKQRLGVTYDHRQSICREPVLDKTLRYVWDDDRQMGKI